MLVCVVFSLALFLSSATATSVCEATPQERDCTSNEDTVRFFFNVSSGRCDSFHWSMCAGGSNSFPDWTSCGHACECQLPPESIECQYSSYNITPYYFDTTENVCKEFPTENGKCSANANYFPSESSCRMSCVCSLPAAAGTGSGDDPSYFFDTGTQRCEEFSYTGEEGNANRFASLVDCKNQCLCGMPKVTGHCMAYFPSFFYNNETSQCENFIYGGCQGNNNRFGTEGDCEDACVSSDLP